MEIQDTKVDVNTFKTSYNRNNMQEVCPATKSFKLCGWDKDASSDDTFKLDEDSFDSSNVHRYVVIDAY